MHPAAWAFAYWLIGCGVAYVAFAWKDMDTADAATLTIFWGPLLAILVLFSPILIPMLALDRLRVLRERQKKRLRDVDRWLEDVT